MILNASRGPLADLPPINPHARHLVHCDVCGETRLCTVYDTSGLYIAEPLGGVAYRARFMFCRACLPPNYTRVMRREERHPTDLWLSAKIEAAATEAA